VWVDVVDTKQKENRQNKWQWSDEGDSFLLRAKKNDWKCLEKEPPRQRTTVATDSSDDQWGFLLFTAEGTKAIERTFGWPPHLRQVHIYVKEALASIWTLRYLMRPNSSAQPLEIVLVGDNTAAMRAIERMYSTNDFVLPFLEVLQKDLDRTCARIITAAVSSAQNPADPAWGRVADEALCSIGWRCVLAGLQGRRLGSYDGTNAPRGAGSTRRGLRHYTPTSDKSHAASLSMEDDDWEDECDPRLGAQLAGIGVEADGPGPIGY
jgi:hypothetical protein